jgi:hypothetical protein
MRLQNKIERNLSYINISIALLKNEWDNGEIKRKWKNRVLLYLKELCPGTSLSPNSRDFQVSF